MDKTVNANADPGNFELIHQIPLSKYWVGENMIVEGVKKPILEPMQVRQINTKSKTSRGSVRTAIKVAPIKNNRSLKKTVTDDLNNAKHTTQAKINHRGSKTKRVEQLLELHDMIGRLLHS